VVIVLRIEAESQEQLAPPPEERGQYLNNEEQPAQARATDLKDTALL